MAHIKRASYHVQFITVKMTVSNLIQIALVMNQATCNKVSVKTEAKWHDHTARTSSTVKWNNTKLNLSKLVQVIQVVVSLLNQW